MRLEGGEDMNGSYEGRILVTGWRLCNSEIDCTT